MEPISLWGKLRSLFLHNKSIFGRWILEWDVAPEAPYHIEDSIIFSADGHFTEIFKRVIYDQTQTSLQDNTTIKCGRYTLQKRVLTIYFEDNDVPRSSSWYIYSQSSEILVMTNFDPSIDGERESIISEVATFSHDKSAKLSDHFNIYRRVD